MKSLYVHFPFCEAKCHYCDFYSLGRDRVRPEDDAAFIAALGDEIRLAGARLAPELDTIFFGGGTPSMTPPDEMVRALEPLWRFTRVTPATEWTMEANPSSISLSSLKGYRALGVNRVSMGVQALRPELLSSLGRVHSREAALRALGELFEAGFDNVSVDLLCGVPEQSLKDLDEAIALLTSFPITHLSCYLLTLPPHHPMHKLLPDEETQLEHLLHIDQALRKSGFEHYEISNFAKPGKRARHNLNYWTGKSYLGLGPSAHSYDQQAGVRWKNVSSLRKYAALLKESSSPAEQVEKLTSEQREIERWLLALRLEEGFPREWLDTPARSAKAELLQKQGLMEPHPRISERLRLTSRGFALSDQVLASLI
ncbi:MAG: radical SAM family heme chaperone HemW [Oligoflexia bacterium]|nr:radical SAM family heme chaperone HemW [Oligoflexia bacterium]